MIRIESLCRAALAVAAILTAPGTAQRATWIVDANNGAGAHFTAIEPAVRGAGDGDLILVRTGLYKGFSVGKPLSIVGESGAGFLPQSGNVTIVNLAAGSDLLLTGFAWTGVATTPVTVHNCRGRVVLDRLTAIVNGANFGVPAVRIEGSAQVSITQCTLFGGPGVSASDGLVTLHDSTVDGHPTYTLGSGFAAQPALAALRCRVFVAGGALGGGDGAFTPAREPSPAVVADACALRVSGTGATRLQAGGSSPLAASALAGAGSTLVLDPAVALLPSGGAPPVAGTINVRNEEVPVLLGRAAGPGGSVRLDLHAAAGRAFAILIGLPGDAVTILDWGTLELDPWLLVVVSAGVLDAAGHVSRSFGVPNAPSLRGEPLAWQALTATTATALRLSNAFVHAVD